MYGNDILAPLDVDNLQNAGLLSPRTNRGTRQMHKRCLNRFSDEENQDIPLNFNFLSAAAQNAFATIPEQLVSRATLEYVGFSERKAGNLWSQWTALLSQGVSRETDPDNGGLQMTFLEFIISSFETGNDTFGEDDQQWRQLMETFGLSTETQRAILDPAFKYLRLSNSCVYWSKDTIKCALLG